MPPKAKPPKANMTPGELNDWRAGQDEAEMRDEIANKTKPVVKSAPKPKAYARGGGIETKGKTKGRFV